MESSLALKILGLNEGADSISVESAFRRLVQKHHPDRGGKHQTFCSIVEAYESLIEIVPKRSRSLVVTPKPRNLRTYRKTPGDRKFNPLREDEYKGVNVSCMG